MIEGNPYKVVAKKYRKRFRADAVSTEPIEIINKKTGEVRVAQQIVGTQKIYDNTDFVKLYNPHILISLSASEIAVFSYIVSKLRFGGYAVMDYADCLSYTQYSSRQAIYRGLQGLKKKDVIRPKGKDEYWVNPNIVYRGQRDEFTMTNY